MLFRSKERGLARIEDALAQLPQVMPMLGLQGQSWTSGAAPVGLRSLGEGRTLTLLNGQRMDNDVNIIPGALIERIDIMTGGASAVYGSDAIAGVVNMSMLVVAAAVFHQQGFTQIADLDERQWIERLRGAPETDAAFLIRRYAALGGDEECGFEIMPYTSLSTANLGGDPQTPVESDFVRHALGQGLLLGQTLGVNPFQLGIVAAVLSVASLVWGLFFSARNTGQRLKANWWLALHNWLGGLTLTFIGLHMVVSLLDTDAGLHLIDLFVPSSEVGWEIGWGVIATWLFAIVVLPSIARIRRRLPRKAWHAVHLLSIPAVVLTGVHSFQEIGRAHV